MALAQGLTVALGLLCRVASGAPAPGNADAGSTQSQIVLQPASHLAHDFEINRNSDGFVASRPPQQQQSRKLTGKFLHITGKRATSRFRQSLSCLGAKSGQVDHCRTRRAGPQNGLCSHPTPPCTGHPRCPTPRPMDERASQPSAQGLAPVCRTCSTRVPCSGHRPTIAATQG